MAVGTEPHQGRVVNTHITLRWEIKLRSRWEQALVLGPVLSMWHLWGLWGLDAPGLGLGWTPHPVFRPCLRCPQPREASVLLQAPTFLFSMVRQTSSRAG